MPRKKMPKSCACGCQRMTKGGKFIPGHDSKVYRAILQHIDGDVADLRAFVEAHTEKPIVVSLDG